MNKQTNIVIDNDTQAIFVNGKKWEKSPESYMHLSRGKTRIIQSNVAQPVVVSNMHITMYQTVQALAKAPYQRLDRVTA